MGIAMIKSKINLICQFYIAWWDSFKSGQKEGRQLAFYRSSAVVNCTQINFPWNAFIFKPVCLLICIINNVAVILIATYSKILL